jgi:DNA polymerase family A
VLLVNRLVFRPALALNHLDPAVLLTDEIATQVFEAGKDPLVGHSPAALLAQVPDIALVVATELPWRFARAEVSVKCALIPLSGCERCELLSREPELSGIRWRAVPRHFGFIERVVANDERSLLVGVPELERAFAEGVDLHQRTADELGVTRDVGKTLNYATLYGAGAPRIATTLGIETEQARAILDRWFGLYPEVGKLKWQLSRAVRKRGYIRSAGGRRHHFEQPNHMMLNRLISGSCAEIFKVALVELHALGVPMILLVHDEIVAEVDEHEADFTARLLEEALARGMGRVDHLVAHAQVAQRWSDFKEPGYVP